MDVMNVCSNLSEQQREAIIANFSKANPHWRGAHVEDIIDALDDADGELNAVESAWDAFPQLHQPGFGSAVRCLVVAGDEVSEDNLRKLLKR